MCNISLKHFGALNGTDSEQFLEEYELDKPNQDITIQMTYFAITTLTTIGFGDFHPKSNFERIIGTVLLLGGVATFSFIYSKVDNAFNKIMQISYPLDSIQKQLDCFFGVLKKLNGNHSIDKELRHEIEKYFEFVWKKDRA